ncbi:MAG: hypothetical protein J1F37_04510, partial [Oscillospiraceae bacterium]|nr:hypothetical protein [Oscillospiraceae bacterium]
IQRLRVEKENGRWVVIPLENFRKVTTEKYNFEWYCSEIPGVIYSGTVSDVKVDVSVQTVHYIDSRVEENNEFPFVFGSSTYFDTTPKPNSGFTTARRTHTSQVTHLGTETERNNIWKIGLSIAPIFSGEERPEKLHEPTGNNSSGSVNSIESWFSKSLELGWEPTIRVDGGGSSIDPVRENELPEYFAADLYINGELSAQMDLHLQEEVAE